MRLRYKIAFVTVAAVAVVLIISIFFFASIFSSLPLDVAATNVAAVNAHYLPIGSKDSRIFLVSASSPRYGYYSRDDYVIGGFKKGTPCFTLTITVRSDYDSVHLPPLSTYDNVDYSAKYCLVFGFSFKTESGTINTPSMEVRFYSNETTPWFYFKIGNGETATYELTIATDHRDISSYELSISQIAQNLPVF